MKINVLPVGMGQTNCYILQSEKNNAILIDPGENSQGILDFCRKNELNVKMIVLTHGHYDHIGAVTQLKSATSASVYIHKLDEELLLNPDLIRRGVLASMIGYVPAKADICYEDGDIITLDDIKLRVMHTSGHTKGSCILIGDDVIFTGDTVFVGTVGRSDLYGGSEEELLASVKKIASLEGDYTLLPGHGGDTTLSYEKITNPYMGTNYDDIF